MAEKCTTIKLLQDCDISISNLSESIFEVLSLSSKLNTVWTSGGITMKEDFQKLLFPGGIFYNSKNGTFRTPDVNFIFRLIACRQRFSGAFAGKLKVHKKWGIDKELIIRIADKGTIVGHRGLGGNYAG